MAPPVPASVLFQPSQSVISRPVSVPIPKPGPVFVTSPDLPRLVTRDWPGLSLSCPCAVPPCPRCPRCPVPCPCSSHPCSSPTLPVLVSRCPPVPVPRSMFRCARCPPCPGTPRSSVPTCSATSSAPKSTRQAGHDTFRQPHRGAAAATSCSSGPGSDPADTGSDSSDSSDSAARAGDSNRHSGRAIGPGGARTPAAMAERGAGPARGRGRTPAFIARWAGQGLERGGAYLGWGCGEGPAPGAAVERGGGVASRGRDQYQRAWAGDGARPLGAGTPMQMKEPVARRARGARWEMESWGWRRSLGSPSPGVPFPCVRSRPRGGIRCTGPGGPSPPAIAAAGFSSALSPPNLAQCGPHVPPGAAPGASVPVGQQRWEQRRSGHRVRLL